MNDDQTPQIDDCTLESWIDDHGSHDSPAFNYPDCIICNPPKWNYGGILWWPMGLNPNTANLDPSGDKIYTGLMAQVDGDEDSGEVWSDDDPNRSFALTLQAFVPVYLKRLAEATTAIRKSTGDDRAMPYIEDIDKITFDALRTAIVFTAG